MASTNYRSSFKRRFTDPPPVAGSDSEAEEESPRKESPRELVLALSKVPTGRNRIRSPRGSELDLQEDAQPTSPTKTRPSVGSEFLLDLQPEGSLRTQLTSTQPHSARPKKSKKKGKKQERRSLPNHDHPSLDSLPGAHNLDMTFKQAIRQERKRQQIIAEMMQTEKTYLEALQILLMLFVKPLRKNLETQPNPFLTSEEIATLFQNIEELTRVNGELLKQMVKRKRNSTLHWADMLLRCWSQENFVHSYQLYINGYTQARLFYSAAMKPAPANPTPEQERLATFAQFINRQLANDLCGGFTNLNSFLITPIQRLPRYLLYLKDLHRVTSEEHPDRQDVEKAYQMLSEMTAHIDQEKLRYDEIYHLQALYQRFVPTDRPYVSELLNPTCKLVAEGPLLEELADEFLSSRKEKTNRVLRYVILFSDSLLCASKDDNDKLHMEWKVNLYASSLVLLPARGSPRDKENIPQGDLDHNPSLAERIQITTRTVTTGFPLSVTSTYTLYPLSEGSFTMKFWVPHFRGFAQGPNELYYLTQFSINKARQIQTNILSPDDWEKLTASGTVTGYQQNQVVQQEGSLVQGLSIIQQGHCAVTKQIRERDVVLGVMNAGELFGEMNFLSESPQKEATATVLAERDDTFVVTIPFDRVYQSLIPDHGLSRRFFLNLCSVLAGRYQKVVFQKTGAYVASDHAEMPLAFLDGPVKCPLSAEASSLLHRLGLSEGNAVAEFPCRMKGKIGKGHLLLCREMIVYFSRATGLFGHFSKTVIPSETIRRVQESSNLISIEHGKGKNRLIELQFYTQAQLKQALVHLANISGRSPIPCGTPPRGEESFQLTQHDWDQLTAGINPTNHEEGKEIIASGSMLTGLYQVVNGRCRIEYQVGENQLGFTIHAGEFFGEVSFILGGVTDSSLTADRAHTKVRLIPFDHLNRTLEKNPALASKLYLLLARSLRRRFLGVQNALLDSKNNDRLLTKADLMEKKERVLKKSTDSSSSLRSSGGAVPLPSHMGRLVTLRGSNSARPRAKSLPDEEENSEIRLRPGIKPSEHRSQVTQSVRDLKPTPCFVEDNDSTLSEKKKSRRKSAMEPGQGDDIITTRLKRKSANASGIFVLSHSAPASRETKTRAKMKDVHPSKSPRRINKTG